MNDMIFGWVTGSTLGLLIVAFCMVLKNGVWIGRLERKIDMLLKHSGIDLTAAAQREAAALMKAGRKIDAIKVYRDFTGAGLAEAKAAVERLHAESS